MPNFKKTVVERTLLRKLGATREEGRDHTKFRLYDDEEIFVAQTKTSRGHSDIDSEVISKMAAQLGVSGRYWADLCRCNGSREEYLRKAADLV